MILQRENILQGWVIFFSTALGQLYPGGDIKHEMAIEAAILHKLSNDSETLFGKWDYISHQVPASPFKPVDYMDRIDIFAYKFIYCKIETDKVAKKIPQFCNYEFPTIAKGH